MNPAHYPRKYLHMLPEERTLWDRFLVKYGEDYSLFEYDIHVGSGVNLTSEEEKTHAPMKQLTRQRIDVVGHQSDRVTIFEVRPSVGLDSVGRLIGYADLYWDEFKPTKRLRSAVVCEIINPGAEKLCNRFKIEIITI